MAVSREHNPNLKDKAGREGFIDNTAAKTLRLLVINILMRSAREYFGADSEIRKPTIDEIQHHNRAEKARLERNKLRSKQRKQFRSKLRKHNKVLPSLIERLSSSLKNLSLGNEEDIITAQTMLDEFRNEFADLRLPGAPSSLGTLEDEYRFYRSAVHEISQGFSLFEHQIEQAIKDIKPPKPAEILEKQLQRNAGQLQSRIRKWRAEIKELQDYEAERLSRLFSERNKIFHEKAMPLVEHVASGDIELDKASAQMEHWRQTIDDDNAEIFEAYILALESLKESIDLEVIASHGAAENEELRAELDRLNGLAQLGSAVEILSHELQSYDDMLASGLRRLPENVRTSRAADNIRLGYEGLTRQLNFLSPLKLSGQRTQKTLTGTEIYEYVARFFADTLKREQIALEATERFRAFSIFEQPSRIFPVFINLINNSLYWISTKQEERKEVILDVIDNRVIVSDNGPGVEEIDIPSLFKLFFTRKLSSGRGVGLYLCRVNLASGGHRIEYVTNKEKMPLKGANFAIEFKGADYDGSQ